MSIFNKNVFLFFFISIYNDINHFLEIVKESVNQLTTDAEFKKIISDWFRYANTRLSRSQIKLSSNLSHD